MSDNITKMQQGINPCQRKAIATCRRPKPCAFQCWSDQIPRRPNDRTKVAWPRHCSNPEERRKAAEALHIASHIHTGFPRVVDAIGVNGNLTIASFQRRP